MMSKEAAHWVLTQSLTFSCVYIISFFLSLTVSYPGHFKLISIYSNTYLPQRSLIQSDSSECVCNETSLLLSAEMCNKSVLEACLHIY